ncbi:MAG: tyrosine-type recombinase/integrase [Dehalococcoidia bacterium]
MQTEHFLKKIKGMSENTKKAYEQSLWLLERQIKGAEPTDDEIRRFLAHYPPKSLNRHKAAMRAYLHFLKREWPFEPHEFPATRRGLPRYVPPEKIQKLIAMLKDPDDKMAITTLFQLGCRISELMGFSRDDVTPAGVRLVTKGGYEKIRPITKEFSAELHKYIKGRRGKIFDRGYSHYYLLLKEYGPKIGFPHLAPHMLRHSRAVDLLRKKMPLPFVQQFLGHANINTTALYLEITGGELGEELQKVEMPE